MQQNEVVVSMEGQGDPAAADNRPAKKERPVWMMESTVEGADDNTMVSRTVECLTIVFVFLPHDLNMTHIGL